MKKLFTLAFALVFSTGIAFGQSNSSSVNQAGNGNGATVNQAGSQNASVIDQFAQGTAGGQAVAATATITQTGADNMSLLDQSAFFGNSEATITQIGDQNNVYGTSSSNAFKQSNGGGVADVYMEGDQNTLYSLRGEAQKNDNMFDLDILGSGNDVGMTQEFGDGTVNVTGDDNDVELRQLAGANYQLSNYHTATIKIGGNGSTGNSNTVLVDQEKLTGGTGGVNNGATVKVLRGDLNTVDVQQFGSDNRQSIEVDGNSNTITAAQTGDNNGLYLNARGTGPGSSKIFSGAGGVDGNSFTMTQHGDDNLVDAGFDGVGNEITIMQDGTGNLVDGPMAGRFDSDGLAIIGDGNMVDVMQTGNGHVSTKMVMGDNNVIDVTQSN
jgi:hypothetical protein